MIFNFSNITYLCARIFAYMITDMNFKFMDPPHQIRNTKRKKQQLKYQKRNLKHKHIQSKLKFKQNVHIHLAPVCDCNFAFMIK